ncbi:DEAD/DEAH box helicase [Candidatus Woesearchaeota archaeon]|nr:DEAD/DEAH box helicase [Candidatus Woesearchaeota archaeon]
MKFKNFILDKFQEDSINAIENNYSVVVSAPTGSGKTLIAEYIIDQHKEDDMRIIYTAPLKALSNQKFRDFSEEYGEEKVGLMTGDIVINPHAKILIMTTEIYRNMAIARDHALDNVVYVIFDEIHFINDVERGYVWEESIIYSSEKVRFLCLSATIPNAAEFSRWIKAIKNHEVKTIVETKRNVPLKKFFFDNELGVTTLEKIREDKEMPRYDQVMGKHGRGRGRRIRVPPPNHVELIKILKAEDKLPCLFFHFSRHACQEKTLDLTRKKLFMSDPKITAFVASRLQKAPYDINKLESTKVLKQSLPQGIGFHHAGLLPVIKEIIEELFSQGLIKVLYTTETFAVGVNMPAKTVCFNSLRKYDGRGFRNLNTKEFFQIAGRAGRRGIDKIGYVMVMIHKPTFSYNEIKSITDKDMEPIKSQFRLSINTVLNLIDQHEEKEIEHILRMSFFSYQKFGDKFDEIPPKVFMARYYSISRRLKKYGYTQDRELTSKGKFSSRIFADEISTGEIFATELWKELDEYQILLVLGALAYEHKKMTKFKKTFDNEQLRKLKNVLYKNEYLSKEKKFLGLNYVTAMIYPVYNGEDFFAAVALTNLLEGDLIRFYSQVLDRIGQIRKATGDKDLLRMIDSCQKVIEKVLEGIYSV